MKNQLFIDEKYQEDKHYYLLAGILIRNKETIEKIADFVDSFKSELRTDLKPDNWYLKGSGACLYQDKSCEKDTKADAFKRWELWAEKVKNLDAYYDFFATLVLTDRFFNRPECNSFDNRQKLEFLYSTSLLSLFYVASIKVTGSIDLFTDNLDGQQAKGFFRGKETLKHHYSAGSLTFGKCNIIKKSGALGGSIESKIMQFLDMQLYAFTRFLILTKNPKLLVNSEEFVYGLIEGHSKLKSAEIENAILLEKAKKHFIFANLYHHLRGKIWKNVSLNDELHSSAILMGKQNHFNFGQEVDSKIWNFFNSGFTAEKISDLFIDLDKYE